MKKVFATILSILLLLFGSTLLAEEQSTEATVQVNPEIQSILDSATPSEGLVFSSKGDGTCTIAGIGSCTDSILVIPDKSPYGDVVTNIDERAFYDCDDIETLIIKDASITIGEYAFVEDKIKNVLIYNSEVTLEDRAFYSCDKIAYIYVYNSTLVVGEYTFYESGDDATIIFANSNISLDEYAFSYCKAIDLQIDTCEIEMGDRAFYYSEDIENLFIYNSSVETGEYAFYESFDDAKVTFEKSKILLDSQTFSSSSMAELTIKECDLEAKDRAFYYCENINTALFLNSTMEIGEYAFYESGDDASLTISGCTISLDDHAFDSSELISVEIENSETELGDRVFYYCEDLETVRISDCNISIGEYAFYECTSLKEVSFENKMEGNDIILDDNAFDSCSKLETATLIGKKVEIGDRVFYYCESLASVGIDSDELKVGTYVFYNCPASLSISCNDRNYNPESFEKQ